MRHRKRFATRTILAFKRDNEKSETRVAVYTKHRTNKYRDQFGMPEVIEHHKRK